MLAEKQLPIESLISGVYPLEDAPTVYEQIRNDELHGVGYLFGYPDADLTATAASWKTAAVDSISKTKPSPRRNTLRVGFIGAGNYATSMLLPHLKDSTDVEFARVVTSTSLSAANARRRFGFSDMSTDVDDVLADDTIDAVFIVTRHESHASWYADRWRLGRPHLSRSLWRSTKSSYSRSLMRSRVLAMTDSWSVSTDGLPLCCRSATPLRRRNSGFCRCATP